MKQQLVLVGGGARSGKSHFALELAATFGPRRLFIATAEGLDDEMAARIAEHRRERGDAFTTIEEPVALEECLGRAFTPADGRVGPPDAIVVDCLTLWISNLLVRGYPEPAIAARIAALGEVLGARRAHVILVSNEVGMGVVPETALGRTFRDVVGRLHQVVAGQADQIFVGLMGIMLRVAPEPIVRVAR